MPNYLVESIASKKRKWIHFNQLSLKQSSPIFEERTIKCRKPVTTNQNEFHLATDSLLEDLNNDYIIINSTCEDVDPLDSTSQLAILPNLEDVDIFEGDISTLDENILDTSSPTIYSTGSVVGSDSGEDNVNAVTSTQIMNDNSNNEEPALRRSTSLRVPNISQGYVY